jgi:hypothetical protein
VAKSRHTKIIPARFFADESGSEETASLTVVGGLVLLEPHFFSFHYDWTRVASTHGVELPIHMREFGRPHGRLAYLTNEQRRALFSDLVRLINRHKLHGLTVGVDNLEFQQFFPAERFRGLIGAAHLAFLWCMILNHGIVRDRDLGTMDYIVDKSQFRAQINDAYEFWKSYEARTEAVHSGKLAFKRAPEQGELQAADLVAWANRRKQLGEPFDEGFQPLDLLTRYIESDYKPIIHFHFPVTRECTEKLAGILGTPVRQKGKRPSLLGVIPPAIQQQIENIRTAEEHVDHT